MIVCDACLSQNASDRTCMYRAITNVSAPCFSMRLSIFASCAAFALTLSPPNFSGSMGRWKNGIPNWSAMYFRSLWLLMMNGISHLSSPFAWRTSKSQRQWSILLTKMPTRCGSALYAMSHESISNWRARFSMLLSSASRLSAPLNKPEKSMERRWKNMPSSLTYCAELRMLHPQPNMSCVRLAMSPLRSGPMKRTANFYDIWMTDASERHAGSALVSGVGFREGVA